MAGEDWILCGSIVSVINATSDIKQTPKKGDMVAKEKTYLTQTGR